jgi:hypothetical protein
LKKAVALLITLALIAIASSIVSMIVSVMDDSLKEVSKKSNLIQSNILFRDVKRILEKNMGDINDSMSLELMFLFPLSFSDATSGISIDIELQSDSMKLNPNLIVMENNESNTTSNRADETLFDTLRVDENIYNFIDEILDRYRIADRNLLIAMMLDTIDEDTNERLPNSEIANTERSFKNGAIESYEHFEKILQHYRNLTLDKNVDTVPWEKLFGFRSRVIDFNYIEPELLGLMLPRLPQDQLYNVTTSRIETYDSLEELPFDFDQKEKLKRYNVAFFSPEVWCNLTFTFDKYSKTLSFQYNLNKKRVSYIENF